MRTSYLLLAITLWSASALSATRTSATTVTGCIIRRPDGSLRLEAASSGRFYELYSDAKLLGAHVNQFVRVSGQAEKNRKNSTDSDRLKVVTVQVIAETCTSPLPAHKAMAVTGKVGADVIAVPLTTTATPETTTGFQTESGTALSRRNKSVSVLESRRLTKSPYAPGRPEQAGQSEAAANRNAEAVMRTEILPGKTLGVGGSVSAAAPVDVGLPGAPSRER